MAGLVFNQGISKYGHAAAIRPFSDADHSTPQDGLGFGLRMWAQRRCEAVEGKVRAACEQVHDVPRFRSDAEVAHDGEVRKAEVFVGPADADPSFELWRPFVVEDRSSGDDYGIDQCVSWADEFARGDDSLVCYDSYDIGLVRLVLRDMFVGANSNGMLMHIININDRSGLKVQLVAHVDDPVYSREVLNRVVDRCGELASALGTPPPQLGVRIDTKPVEYSVDIDVAESPVLIAGESTTGPAVKPLVGWYFSDVQSSRSEPIPPPSPVQPESGRGVRYSRDVPAPALESTHPLASADPYLTWCAGEMAALAGPIPDGVIACAVASPGDDKSPAPGHALVLRCWVKDLEPAVYSWLADWQTGPEASQSAGFSFSLFDRIADFRKNFAVGRKSISREVEIATGLPCDDPSFDQWRPWMFFDRSGRHADYRADLVLPCPDVSATASSEASSVGAALAWLAGRGFEWFPGRWAAVDTTSTGFEVHLNPGEVEGAERKVAAYRVRCEELVGALFSRPVAVSVRLSQSVTFPESAIDDDSWNLVHYGPRTWPGSGEARPHDVPVTWIAP